MEKMKLENWNGFEIRFVSVNDEWHAIAMDVANALDYSDANKMVKRISKKYVASIKVKLTDLQNGGRSLSNTKSTNRQNGGRSDTREYITLTELGIYEAVIGSKKPQAKQFKDWIYNTIKQLRQSVGLEAYEAFRMLDKQKQREAMDIIKTGIDKPERRHYIKVNSIANKAIAIKYGYPKAIKKEDMTPQQVAERDEIAQEVAKLMTLNDKYGLDISVSDAIYSRYGK